MSIEITGPERYEFQYYVSLELVLRFWTQNVSAVVDSGGEDLTLCVEIDGRPIELEVQVKGAENHRNAVDGEVLRGYLAHFPSRESKNSLLERLLNQPDKLVLLVCTQRAKDFASNLTVRSNWRGEAHNSSPLAKAAAKSFLDQITAYKPVKNTNLERARAASLNTLGKQTTPSKLADSFKRLALQENVTKEQVIASTQEHLRSFGVPNDRLEVTHLKMLQQVRDSKGTGNDVVPALKDLLSTEIAPQVRPRDYVQRGNEKALSDELSTNRALLLSGPPRCGKTDTAKWIAGDLQGLGFEVISTSLVDEAERALLDRSRTQILVILDDPLGSDFEMSSKAGQTLKKLDRLIRELEPNRRLIVAQSQEVLLATKAIDSLEKINTGGLLWHNLGTYSAEFLAEVWNVHSRQSQVPETVKTALAAAIAARTVDFPAGVLTHIAAYHQRLQGADVIRQAQNLASESANDFAVTLQSSDAKEVLRALAIGSSTVETSADQDLAFILGDGLEPEISKLDGFHVISLCNESDRPFTEPRYVGTPSLPENAYGGLINLERHRVLRRDKSNRFQFSHPYYRSAARAVVRQAVSIEKDQVLSEIRRGLFSPSSNTSAATARNLWWLYSDLAESLGLSESLINLAEKGLHWYFPATRDLCYQFLIDIFKTDPDKHEEKLERWVSIITKNNFDDVLWDRNEPIIPISGEFSIETILKRQPAPDEARVSETLAKLSAGGDLPSQRNIAEALNFFRSHPNQLDHDVVFRLFSYPEALIRAEAAYCWLIVERTNDDEILKRLQRDTHPSVVSRILDATIKVWQSAGDNRKINLAELLRASNTQPETAAVVVLGLLKHFAAEDYTTRSSRASKPWGIIGEILAPALRYYPHSFRMMGDRLYDVCETALLYLPETPSAAVAKGWISWLQVLIDAGKLPDDYMLGLVPSLLSAPKISPEDRQACIEMLLALPSTGAVEVFVANLVEYWNELRDSERAMVTKLLASRRSDEVWLKAAALIQRCVPEEIQQLLLGATDGLNLSAAELINNLSPALLTACVSIHRGQPQPLWYLGNHHRRSSAWNDVIRHLARMPEHPLFENCLEELFSYEKIYGSDALSGVIRELNDSGRERVFNLLLEWKKGVTNDWHQYEFDLLLELAANSGAREKMVKSMVNSSEEIIEELEDIQLWSHRPDVQNELIQAFIKDFNIYKQITKFREFEKSLTEKQKTNFAVTLITIAEANPPQLIKTHWVMEHYLKQLAIDDSYHERARILREKAIKKYDELRNSKHRNQTGFLPNWIGPQ